MTLRVDARVVRGEFALDVAFTAESGQVVAVLGPNGAGKSTLLRAVAGLQPITAGRIELAGAVLDDASTGRFVEPAQRRMGVVFQDHRLFPHLRVIDNVAFALRAQGVPRDRARLVAAGWLDLLGVAALARRRPRQLSGGQAQRVALARALAAEPSALLMDEPLAALDVQTRADVQAELREHLGSFAGPTLIVTHDPIEALLLAHRIVVLEGGRIVQQGTPAEIAGRPATTYVAKLVGVNLFAGRIEQSTVRVDGGGQAVVAEPGLSGRVLVALRPSAITVHTERPAPSSARNLWPGRVTSLAPLADRIRLTVDAQPPVLVDVTPTAVAELDLHPGREVWISAKATDLVAYPEPPEH